MPAGNLRMYLLLAMVIFFVGLPITKSFLQEMSIGQDIRRIDTEYSLHGAKYFRERLDEIILRSTLDPKRVAIQVQENQRTAKVLVEVRYLSRLNIVVFPLEREVVVREEIPLVPL